MMKRRPKEIKEFKLTEINPNITIESKTINYLDLKSFFIVVECWYESDVDARLWGQKIKKNILSVLDKEYFNTEILISDLDVPKIKNSSIYHSMFEYTIFLKKPNIIDHKQLSVHAKKICKMISGMYDSAEFKFYKRKKDAKENNN